MERADKPHGRLKTKAHHPQTQPQQQTLTAAAAAAAKSALVSELPAFPTACNLFTSLMCNDSLFTEQPKHSLSVMVFESLKNSMSDCYFFTMHPKKNLSAC